MMAPALPDSGLRPAPRGGFAPATRLETKTKTFLRRKTMKTIGRRVPPAGRDRRPPFQTKVRKNLLEVPAKG